MHKKIFGLATALAAMLLAVVPASAQTYPSKTVRIIVPYQAGQGTDVVARYIAERLSKALGQTFYIDNKPGAGGNIGTEAGARATPDGYSLTMGTNGTHSMNQFLYASMSVDPGKDFAPVILIGMLPMVIAANPSFAPNSVAELIATAKARPDKVDVALPSTTARMVLELLKVRTGAPLFGVPYKGSATALTEVTGGQVQTLVDTVAAARGQITAGKLKPLGITTLKPSELLPGVRPVAEQGVPDFQVTGWMALYAPNGTPEPIVQLLNSEVAKILAAPETRARMLQIGVEPAGGTPGQLAQFEQNERALWGPLIKAAGLKGD
ncbi:MAG: Bug family tripartite tricarboxylate transporter substrate binding protein [Reyranella sp.]|uniref:Bug family tripartite tricarboxylate transporter substrate binding protein n=1 Tax=Reyranella sp. TaxID=1929291 RepID=UPI003D12B03B